MIQKLIIILVLSTMSQADVKWFYGEWTPVILFPKVPALPICTKYLYLESPSKLQCTCADGRNTTLVAMDLLESTIEDRGPKVVSEMPMTEADDTTDVTSLIRVSCTCGENTFRQRVVVESINKDYAVMYEYQESLGYYTEKERNTAYVMAKNIETAHVI